MTPKFVFYLRIFMALCFIAMAGCTIYFKDKTQLSDTQTYLFAALLLVYGIFRIYRAYKFSDDIFVEK